MRKERGTLADACTVQQPVWSSPAPCFRCLACALTRCRFAAFSFSHAFSFSPPLVPCQLWLELRHLYLSRCAAARRGAGARKLLTSTGCLCIRRRQQARAARQEARCISRHACLQPRQTCQALTASRRPASDCRPLSSNCSPHVLPNSNFHALFLPSFFPTLFCSFLAPVR